MEQQGNAIIMHDEKRWKCGGIAGVGDVGGVGELQEWGISAAFLPQTQPGERIWFIPIFLLIKIHLLNRNTEML